MDLKALADQALARINNRTEHRTNSEQDAVRSDPILFGKVFVESNENVYNEKKEESAKAKAFQPFYWPREDKALIDWFLSVTNLPTDPFQLKQAVYVQEPQKYYASLRNDIAQGPHCPRARYGALLAELRLLKEIFESGLALDPE